MPSFLHPEGVLTLPNEDAKVWLDGALMPHTGKVRKFVTDVLPWNKDFTIECKISWLDGKNENTFSRNFFVQAGDEHYVSVPVQGKSPVALTIGVPTEHADVWIDDAKMRIKGMKRTYNIPALEAKRTYSQEFKTQWTADGRSRTFRRILNYQAGDKVIFVVPPTVETEKVPTPMLKK